MVICCVAPSAYTHVQKFLHLLFSLSLFMCRLFLFSSPRFPHPLHAFIAPALFLLLFASLFLFLSLPHVSSSFNLLLANFLHLHLALHTSKHTSYRNVAIHKLAAIEIRIVDGLHNRFIILLIIHAGAFKKSAHFTPTSNSHSLSLSL